MAWSWKIEDALNNDARQRLRKVLGREPTAEEIRQLRQGEHALGVEHATYANARQLVTEARKLRKAKDELMSETRKKRKRAGRLQRAAAKSASRSSRFRR